MPFYQILLHDEKLFRDGSSSPVKKIKKNSNAYLHHKEDGVEHNEGHDEVLEGRGDDDPPELVLEAVPLPGHVALKRLRVDREVNTGLLQCTQGGIRYLLS